MEGKCNECGKTSEVVAHHLSYTPEIKIQLCKSCHKINHGKNKELHEEAKEFYNRKKGELLLIEGLSLEEKSWLYNKAKKNKTTQCGIALRLIRDAMEAE